MSHHGNTLSRAALASRLMATLFAASLLTACQTNFRKVEDSPGLLADGREHLRRLGEDWFMQPVQACKQYTSPAIAVGKFQEPLAHVDLSITRGDRTLPIFAVPELRSGDTLNLQLLQLGYFEGQRPTAGLILVGFLGVNGQQPDAKEFYLLRIPENQPEFREKRFRLPVLRDHSRPIVFFIPTDTGEDVVFQSVAANPRKLVNVNESVTSLKASQSRLSYFLEALSRDTQFGPGGRPYADRVENLARDFSLEVGSLPDWQKRKDELNRADLPPRERNQKAFDTLSQAFRANAVIRIDDRVVERNLAQLSADALDRWAHKHNRPEIPGYVGTLVGLYATMKESLGVNITFVPALPKGERDASFYLCLDDTVRPERKNMTVAVFAAGSATVRPPALRLSESRPLSCLQREPWLAYVGKDEEGPWLDEKYPNTLQLHIPELRQTVDLVPDPALRALRAANLAPSGADAARDLPARVAAKIVGRWGFDPLTEPAALAIPVASRKAEWTIAPAFAIVGENRAIELTVRAKAHAAVECVREVALTQGAMRIPGVLQSTTEDTATYRFTLGELRGNQRALLEIVQWGGIAQRQSLLVYDNLPRIARLEIREGDDVVSLRGDRLELIEHVELKGADSKGAQSAAFRQRVYAEGGQLILKGGALAGEAFAADRPVEAVLRVKGGLEMPFSVSVLPSRPAFAVTPVAAATVLPADREVRFEIRLDPRQPYRFIEDDLLRNRTVVALANAVTLKNGYGQRDIELVRYDTNMMRVTGDGTLLKFALKPSSLPIRPYGRLMVMVSFDSASSRWAPLPPKFVRIPRGLAMRRIDDERCAVVHPNLDEITEFAYSRDAAIKPFAPLPREIDGRTVYEATVPCPPEGQSVVHGRVPDDPQSSVDIPFVWAERKP